MDPRTHILIANKIYSGLEPMKKSIIKKKNFIYGNVKPDMISKYKLKKHYRKESYDIIVNKIEDLAKINDLNDIQNKKFFCNFSQELGVICHFICDFFCVPHDESERWEFKHSMVRHIAYEKKLNLISRNYFFKKNIKINLDYSRNIRDFLDEVYIDYKNNKYLNSYERDLDYSYNICIIIISSIINELLYHYRKTI